MQKSHALESIENNASENHSSHKKQNANSANHSNNTSNTNNTNNTNNPPALTALECSDLLTDLEGRLMLDPANRALQLAFEQALNLCRPVKAEMNQSNTPTKKQINPVLFTLDFKVGTHSNPMLTSSFNNLQVVLNGQNFILNNPETARASSYQSVGLDLDYRFMQKHKVQLTASHIKYNNSKTADYDRLGFQYHRFFDQALFSIVYNKQGFTNAHYASLGARGVYSYNPKSFSSLGLSRTSYSNVSQNDGTVIEANQFFILPMNDTFKWQFGLGYGMDYPLFDRAGGIQRTLQASIGFEKDINKHRIRFNTRLAKVDDSKVYSQILLNQPVRSLINQNSQLKWHYLGLEKIKPEVALSYVRQSSNIVIFDWSYWSAEVSMQIKW